MEISSALISLVISMLLLLAAPYCVKKFRVSSPLHKYFFIYCITTAGALFLTTLASTLPVLNSALLLRTGQALLGTGIASFFVISFIFPENRAEFPAIDALLLMSPALIISILALVTDFSVSKASFQGYSLKITFGGLYKYYQITLFNYMALAILNLVMKYFKYTDARRHIRNILIGTLCALFLTAFFPFIFPKIISGINLNLLGPSLGIICSIASLSTALRLPMQFDRKQIISSSKFSGIMSIILFIPIYGLTALYELKILDATPAFAFAVVLVAIFLFTFTTSSSYRNKTITVNGNSPDELVQCNNLDELYQKSREYLEKSLQYNKVFFSRYNHETSTFDSLQVSGTEALSWPESEDNQLAGWFYQNRRIIHSESLPNGLRTDTALLQYVEEFISTNDLSSLVPVYFREELAGLISLSGKTYSEFRPGEISDLGSFQQIFNVIFANLLRFESVNTVKETTDSPDFISGALSQALPASLPNMQQIKFGSFYLKRNNDDGNFFDFLRPGANSIGIAATDLTGHGINRALYAVFLRSSFQSCLPEAAATDSIMQRVNRAFCTFKGGSSANIPAWYSYYDSDTKQLTYTNAGFASLQLYRANSNEFETLDTEGTELGRDLNYEYNREQTELNSDDIGFLFSHDLIHIKNAQGEEFGIKRLLEAVQKNKESNAIDITRAIYKTLSAFAMEISSESDTYLILFKIL